IVTTGLAHTDGREDTLGPLAGASSADFNAKVPRKRPAGHTQLDAFNAGNEITGNLQIPLLTMHTTGDWQVPIDQEQTLRRAVDASGKDDLLVQRIIRDPDHCGFLDGEWEQGLRDLIS